MLFLKSENINPYFNLAMEEYLLRNSTDEFFILWKSEPAVIVGKHQNTYAEINYPFIKEKKIHVARRITGGGAVYHDQGNLNYTFICNGEEGKLINFKRFITPVIRALGQMQIPAVHGEKNDILLHGKKISGNAEHVWRNRVIHHGTLLIHADLDNLKNALNAKPGRYFDKAVSSKRSVVTNISDHSDKKIAVDTVSRILFDFIGKKEVPFYQFSANEITQIQKLQKEKFETWSWIFGYSPHYLFTHTFMIDTKCCSLNLEVEKGMIQKITVTGSYFSGSEANLIADLLTGIEHNEGSVKRALTSVGNEKIKNPEIFLREFF